jgi:hypothetical protein
MKITLDGMTARELRGLRDRIDATIETKQKEAKAKLRDEFAALCVEHGTTLAEVAGTAKQTGRRPMNLTAWRDKKTGAIWRGIGRYPPLFDKARAEPLP